MQNEILKHCKKHLDELREKVDNNTYPGEVRARYIGAFYAYKDINDGIEKGYFNILQKESDLIDFIKWINESDWHREALNKNTVREYLNLY